MKEDTIGNTSIIWLSQSETGMIPDVRNQMLPLAHKRSRKQPTPFVFVSGNTDLHDTIKDLLQINSGKGVN